MTMSMNEIYSYERLKEHLKNERFSLEVLNQLKETFKTRIDSNRRLSSIHTLEELIDILERRDILSHRNVDALKEIGQYSTSPTFHDGLRRFEPVQESNPTRNQYREIRLRDELETNLRISSNVSKSNSILPNSSSSHSTNVTGQIPSTPVTAIPDDKKEPIYRKLSKEVGRYWRAFGRELHVSEGQMDEIEEKYSDLSSRVYRLLSTFEEDKKNDPKHHLQIIRDALDNCKRKDLRKAVDQILSY